MVGQLRAPITLIFALALVLPLQPTPASAGPLIPNRAEPVDVPPEMARRMIEKRALSDMLALVEQGLADRNAYERRLAEFLSVAGGPAPEPTACPDNPCTSLTHKYLNMTQETQIETDYCGPASGKALLRTLGLWWSAWNGNHVLLQRNLALDDYFERTAGAPMGPHGQAG